MDRLEPVLKQKFWILLGLGLILTMSGWYMATSALAKQISDRTSSIESSFKTVQGSSSGEIPNESWAKRLGAINSEQTNSIQGTKLSMWKRQRERMTWPDGITDPGYRQKFANPQRELFRDSYEDEVRRVWKTVNPFNKNDGSGIVEYPLINVFILLKQKPWDVAPPDSDTMWNVREDLWLLESLFQTITAMNGGMDVARGDACIHQIDRLELRGGGEKLRDNSGGGGGGGGGGSAGGSMEMMHFATTQGMMGPGGAGPGAPAGPRSITEGLKMVSPEFDAAEEFGDDGNAASMQPGGGGGFAGFGMSTMLGSAGGSAGGSGAATTAPEIKRYLMTDPNLPYKKRGFYLSVKMDHTKIPQLIAELTANERSPWPIEIVRVQMSRLNEDDSTAGIRQRPGMAGAGAMGSALSMLPTGPIGSAAGFNGPDGENPAGANPFNDFANNLKPDSGPDLSNSQHTQAMRAAMENALKDPVMAQVTICGMFTLYKDVPEPEQKPPATTTPAAETPAASADQPAASESEPAATPAADPAMETTAETAEPAANAAEMNAAADTAEKPEKPEGADSKPESGEKPGNGEPKPAEPKPDSGGEKTEK